MQGTIVKGIAGFYYVKCGHRTIECKSRGKFRYSGLSPTVGDKVDISVNGDTGIIEKVYPRTSIISRPSVANVTQAIIVFAIKNPEVNEELLNKMILNCEVNNLKIIVCFNKLDLDSEGYKSHAFNMVKSAGYEVIFSKAKEGFGIDKIKDLLKGHITVLCGPSGVGKSTILNNIAGKQLMETGIISSKLKKGRHTTRHSELIEVCGGLLVDTPGFSSLNVNFIKKEQLMNFFPEFQSGLGKCKFKSCLHYKEPGCAIKNMVEEGKINEDRYNFYIKILEEITSKEKNMW
ncbi:ribosome small subunit-dependent GTPase A [Clostridium sp. cel8]|jgi:ribosome biogenesis GTPase / thiamine phosphate phosphatase|uniref:ribosome small subunit-dependent GTPase A n=1 Tax=unclassified Clostridium TaxID=2614128 RepID=UPI0015F5C378|nr:ribosome small subunit-dependent GTPase A [Clostridium sp. cel8]MBA5850516.1 ribosome small subunit-dependent GTPase A [Clostridium sp. cel8]